MTDNDANNIYPSWSPDSKKIIFCSNRDGSNVIFTMNADGSEQRKLVDKLAFFARWSPDGRRIAFIVGRYPSTEIYIWILKMAGSSGRRDLTDTRWAAPLVPAQTVTLRTLVPKEGLMAANALMQQAFQMMRIVSPALAGLMVERLGANSCYYVDSASFIFSASMIATLLIARAPAKPAPGRHPVKSIVHDLSAGIKFIFTHETLAFVILAMSAARLAI